MGGWGGHRKLCVFVSFSYLLLLTSRDIQAICPAPTVLLAHIVPASIEMTLEGVWRCGGAFIISGGVFKGSAVTGFRSVNRSTSHKAAGYDGWVRVQTGARFPFHSQLCNFLSALFLLLLFFESSAPLASSLQLVRSDWRPPQDLSACQATQSRCWGLCFARDVGKVWLLGCFSPFRETLHRCLFLPHDHKGQHIFTQPNGAENS